DREQAGEADQQEVQRGTPEEGMPSARWGVGVVGGRVAHGPAPQQIMQRPDDAEDAKWRDRDHDEWAEKQKQEPGDPNYDQDDDRIREYVGRLQGCGWRRWQHGVLLYAVHSNCLAASRRRRRAAHG